MSGLFRRRPSGRGHLYLSYRRVLGVLLLATQALVSPLLAQYDYYTLSGVAEASSVRIYTDKGAGMGCRIEDGATIVTCAHVVGDNRWVDVETSGKMERALVLAKSDHDDVAILRVNAPRTAFTYKDTKVLPDIESKLMVTGQTQTDLRPKAKVGNVKAYFYGDDPNVVLDVVPIFGYSGGPVIAADGQLVGIVKGYAYMGDLTGTEVIPLYKALELVKRTRDNLLKGTPTQSEIGK
jgi:S1-C subfamily serine protease